MQVATPFLMKATTAELLRNKVKGRKAFKQFIDSARIVSDVVRDVVTSQVQIADDRKVVYWIGGSQAWSSWQQDGQIPLKSALEESAFTAGNADIFYVCDSLATCEKFVEELEGYLIPWIKQQCEERLALVDGKYKIKVVRNGFEETKPRAKTFTLNEPTVYTLFPGYNVMFELEVPKERARRGDVQDMHVDGEFEGKLAIYIDVSYAQDVNLQKFKSSYLVQRGSLWFPNEMGLLTFGMLIPTSRAAEKGLDVDTLRKEVLLRSVQSRTGMSVPAIHNEITALYHNLLYGTPAYVSEFIDKVFIMNVKLIDPNIEELCSHFEAFLIEALRPTINTFIVETSNQINEKWKKSPDTAFMFLAGGDAMRRYKKDITVTKDIDTKIYIAPGVKSVKTEVERIVAKNLSKLTCYLSQHKTQIFGGIPSDRIEYNAGKLKCGIVFLTNSSRNLQYRIRLIKKTESFPVTLYSVDFRGYLTGELDGKRFSIRYDVPIVDVVIQDNDHGFTRAQAVEMRHTNAIPVATRKFLVEDIVHTYENEDLAVMRYGAGKVKKDKDRFKVLRALPKSSPGRTSTLGNEVMGHKVPINATNTHYSMYHDNVVASYYDHFVSLRQKMKGLTKYKMSFNGEALQKAGVHVLHNVYVGDKFEDIAAPMDVSE